MQQAPPDGRERRSPTAGAVRKRDAIRRLKEALAGQRLTLQYQPLVDARSGGVAAVEALMRWRAPAAEADNLTRLIWSAERSPVIFNLENWVLDQAFRTAAQWREGPVARLRLNVNVSAREFPRADLVRRLSRLLHTASLDARRVGIEVTETSGMRDLEAVADQLRGLRDLGIELWLDDFGTGHSSLEWLSHFPLDGVKIAGTFVERLFRDRRCQVIAGHVIGLAHDLGLRVVAEGVESAPQRAFLEERGCDLLQGFLLYPALPAEELKAALAGTAAPGVRSGR